MKVDRSEGRVEIGRDGECILRPATPPGNDHITEVENFRIAVIKKNKNEPEFLQAFEEVFESVKYMLVNNPEYLKAFMVAVEPERYISFRVTWFDDNGVLHVNRGYRVQYSSAVGPYKGGLRFHPSVSMSVVKFLGFEQIFKNALTGLQMGGAKGGADFDPKGKSDSEIIRFCQSFMTELTKHIGPSKDVPAGDIGVGTREIGYMYGQYRRITCRFEGSITGKDIEWGGSEMRPEATGYGCVYFVDQVYKHIMKEESLAGKVCCVSGSGNVALYCAEKLLDLGAKVVTVSDSTGVLHCPAGFNDEELQNMKMEKAKNPGWRVSSGEIENRSYFKKGKKPWHIACEIAFPCSTQNEINIIDAKALSSSGCRVIVEGANMPTDTEAVTYCKNNNIIICPAKAANAGGVAVSGLEMSQNAMRIRWSKEEVDSRLRTIMSSIFYECYNTALYINKKKNNISDNINIDLIAGANVAAFRTVADAIIAQGYC